MHGLLGVMLISGNASAAQAASARCFMHGIITPPGATKTVLSDMIRLHFDADEQKKCEEYFVSYCQIQVVEKGFSTDRLKAMFRAATKADAEEKGPESRYKFDPKCKLVPDTEEEEKK